MTKKSRRTRKSSSRLPREIEATLVICSEEPQVVVRQIADVASIANYQLVPQDAQGIHDFYLDTADQELQAQKLALRVREIAGSIWLTIKGPSQPSDRGGMERLEIEEPWSDDALTRVVEELTNRGVKILEQHQAYDYDHPLDVMKTLGLEVVQDRETHREIRNILKPGEKGGPLLAELAIDSVVYRFSAQDICHHEVEIEAKVENASIVLKTVIESLLEKFGTVLRKWDHSKLATGKAIERLLSEKAPARFLDMDNNLKPDTYEKIDCYLNSGTI